VKNVVEGKHKETIRSGDIFLNEANELYILAVVGKGPRVVLIWLESGNRWLEPEVVKDPFDISEQEWANVTGGYAFEKVGDGAVPFWERIGSIKRLG